MPTNNEIISIINKEIIKFHKSIKYLEKLNGAELILQIDKIIGEFSNATNKFFILIYIHPDKNFVSQLTNLETKWNEYLSKLYSNRILFEKINHYDNETKDYINEIDPKIIKKIREIILKNFISAGTNLSNHNFKKFKHLTKNLQTLEQQFSKNLRDHKIIYNYYTKCDDGENNKTGETVANNETGEKIDLAHDSLYNKILITECDENIRKDVFINKFSAIDNNKILIEEILKVRLKIAKLFGKKTWLDNVITNKSLIGGVDNMFNMLEKLAKKYQPLAKKEIIAISKNCGIGYQHYNLGYCKDKYLQKKYSLTQQEQLKIKKYFKYENILSGVFHFFEQTFSLVMKTVNIDESDYPFSLSDIKSFITRIDVYSEYEKIGKIYLDLKFRDGKYKHAMCSNLQNNSIYEKHILPSNIVVMSIPNDGIFLMKDFRTFVHEFGHAIYNLFHCSKNKPSFLSGTNYVVRDFIETPSQLLEVIALKKENMKIIFNGMRTQLITKLVNSENEFPGIYMMRIVGTALFDASIHTLTKHNIKYSKIIKIFQNIEQNLFGVKMGKIENHFPTMFTHFDGYAGKYYTYAFNKKMCNDIFKRIEKEKSMKKQKIIINNFYKSIA